MQASEPQIPRPLTVGAVALIGTGVALGTTLFVVGLALELVSSLLVTAAVYFAAGWLVGRRAPRAPRSTLLALVAPVAALYALLALNAESWTPLGIVASALAAASIGAFAGYRSPGRSTSGAGHVE